MSLLELNDTQYDTLCDLFPGCSIDAWGDGLELVISITNFRNEA